MRTGAGVLGALNALEVTAKDIVVSRKGDWLVNGFVRQPEQALSDVDVAFIALHGAYGEDGTVQRLLDRLRVPYTGSGPFASALAMNKQLAKERVSTLGIKVPRGIKLAREGTRDVRQAAYSIGHMFGPEYVVKPVNGGSSINTVMASGEQALLRALEAVFASEEVVLVEERIQGREATVGVLECYRGQSHYTLPTIEIVPPTESFFTHEAKYSGNTEEICPGRFSRDENDALLRAASAVHTLLDLRHYSRADFILTPEGPYFLEVNTLPGLTNESLLPRSVEAVGGTYTELVVHLLKLAANDM